MFGWRSVGEGARRGIVELERELKSLQRRVDNVCW